MRPWKSDGLSMFITRWSFEWKIHGFFFSTLRWKIKGGWEIHYQWCFNGKTIYNWWIFYCHCQGHSILVQFCGRGSHPLRFHMANAFSLIFEQQMSGCLLHKKQSSSTIHIHSCVRVSKLEPQISSRNCPSFRGSFIPKII